MSRDPLFAEIIESGVLVDMGTHAAQEYPSEACGVLIPSAERGLRAVAFDNIQDQLHALDAERYPRTSRTAYNMNSLKLQRTHDEHGVRVIYHSHVDCGAYFSDEDHRGAVTPDTGDPLLPGVDYLVMSIHQRTPRSVGLFRYTARSGRFEQVAEADLVP